MLIFLLIFASIRTLRGIPLSSSADISYGIAALNPRDTQTHFGQRGVNDIIISCFATIFACTWSAIHPNIPAVTDSAWTCFKRRVTLTICALLAPELLTWLAIRQRWGAKNIMDEYNRDLGEDFLAGHGADEGGSSGFNAIKGWFEDVFGSIWGLFEDSSLPTSMVEGKGPRWTLAHGFFLQMGGFMMCENGVPIQILTQDTRKSKVTQIIHNIRAKNIVPPRITEEDIEDRSKGDAISKMFIVLQTTWFVVQCIARWSLRLPVTELEVVTLGFAMLNGITYGLWWHKPQHVGRPVFLERRISGKVNRSNPRRVEKSWLQQRLRKDVEVHTHSPTFLWRVPVGIFLALLRPLLKMIGDRTVKKLRVGIFYTGYKEGGHTTYITTIIGTLFGALHLIPGWFLDFPSRQEMWLWRASAIVITVDPMLLGLMYYLRFSGYDTVAKFTFYFGFVCLPLYPISRIILLILSLAGLRSLPPAALQTIEWIVFFPHI